MRSSIGGPRDSSGPGPGPVTDRPGPAGYRTCSAYFTTDVYRGALCWNAACGPGFPGLGNGKAALAAVATSVSVRFNSRMAAPRWWLNRNRDCQAGFGTAGSAAAPGMGRNTGSIVRRTIRAVPVAGLKTGFIGSVFGGN